MAIDLLWFLYPANTRRCMRRFRSESYLSSHFPILAFIMFFLLGTSRRKLSSLWSRVVNAFVRLPWRIFNIVLAGRIDIVIAGRNNTIDFLWKQYWSRNLGLTDNNRQLSSLIWGQIELNATIEEQTACSDTTNNYLCCHCLYWRGALLLWSTFGRNHFNCNPTYIFSIN